MRTPDNAIARTSYSGNTVTVTDQVGKARKSVSDALGRLTSVYEDPNGLNYQTSYSYDLLNDLTTVNQGVQTRTFVYDSLKRVTSATNPESGTTSYTYDNNGNLLTKTDARNYVTTIAYDAMNRPTSKTYQNDGGSTPAVAYFYDAQTLPGGAPTFNRGYSTGRLVAVTYGGGSAGNYFGYDATGRTLRKIQQTDSVNYLAEASYNVSGAMTSQTYPSVPGASDRRTISYSFDAAGRLNSLSSSATSYSPAASVSNLSYASHGALASETYGNGLIHAATYNNRLQTSEIKLGTSGNPTSVIDLIYNYGTTNNNGNVQSVNYSGGGLSYTQSFSYDALNRLLTAQENSGASWSQTNGYDRYGNRWIDLGGGNQSIYVSTGTNRITNAGFIYDSSGNLTNDTIHSYTYDGQGHVKTVDSNTAYDYDGSGARVRKLVGENTRFVYGLGGELIMEFNGSTGNLTKEYVSGGGMMAIIEPTAINSNGTRYSTSDNLGSPRVVTNSSAGVVSRHDYMPFGEELGAGVGGRTTGMGFSIADGNRKKFTGYEADGETGLNFAEARYQSAAQGRFTSPDPLSASMAAGDPQSFNRYAYVGNNPLVFVDPSGMSAERGGPALPGAIGALGRVNTGYCPPTEPSESPYVTTYDIVGVSVPAQAGVATAAAGALVSGLAEVTVPQNVLVQDDPETIQGERNTNDCSLTVSFRLGTFYEDNSNYPNGPSNVTFEGHTYFGLGFTMSGTVRGGNGIGQIGVYQNPDNPNGKWIMEQWTSSYATSRGEIMTVQGRRQSGGEGWRDMDLQGIHSAARNSSKFSRYDHPSIGGDALFKNQSFHFKVSNGIKMCYADFHIVQRGNTIHWGRGASGVWPK